MPLIIFLFFFIILPFQHIFAIYDPLSVPNNKYGIHIADVNDLSEAAKLVNSENGDWGYITLVIGENDRNTQKWQEIFNSLRRDHLIPIVRLATSTEKNWWKIPADKTLDDWIIFLNSLNWPIKNRYIVIYNEPNHALEWGGTIDPEGYAQILVNFATRFKNTNEDFFILPAGLDASASNTYESMDISQYLQRMITSQPEILDKIDGWTSHSYPNPGFSASPYNSGKGTIRSFEWEISYLKSLGLKRTLPVFITETGWTHSFGMSLNSSLLTPETISDYIKIASETIWNSTDIVAVTPFVFNYQDVPFDHFSLKKIGVNEFYDHYFAYKILPKIKGQPIQNQSYEVKDFPVTSSLVSNSTYSINFSIKNMGQNILDPQDGYEIKVSSENSPEIEIQFDQLPRIEPDKSDSINLLIHTGKSADRQKLAIEIGRSGNWVKLIDKTINIVNPVSLNIYTKVAWKKPPLTLPVEVIVYDQKQTVIDSYNSIIINNEITIPEVLNIIPGQFYRIVVTAKGYLPIQQISTIYTENNTVSMKRMLPLDFNKDGKFSFADIRILIINSPLLTLNKFL